MDIRIIWLVASAALTVVTCSQPGSKIIRCMACHKAPTTMHCEGIELCNPEHAVCYVEEEIDIGGEVVINAGCRLKEHCDNIGCYGENIPGRRKREVVSEVTTPEVVSEVTTPDFTTRDITCHHCCDTNFCNMYGCPDKYDGGHMLVQRCFVCNEVTHPEVCFNVENCDLGESCYIEHVMIGSERRYNLGCMKTRMCEMLEENTTGLRRRRRSVPVLSECCTEQMCNGDLPLLQEPPSMQSETYVCPKLGGTTVPVKETVCEDLVDCDVYGYDYACNGGFDEWAQLSCRKFCGYCTEPDKSTYGQTTQEPLLVLTSEPCQDKLDCSVYGYEYACLSGFDDWSQENCGQFCGHCKQGSSVTVVTEPCVDTDPDCADYGHQYICQGDYLPWSEIHCKKYCGLCDTTTTTTVAPVISVDCHDADTDCADYGEEYICHGDYIPWSQIHCQQFCGFCKKPECVDEATDCADYGFNYICTGDYIPWSKLNCAKFCNFCGEVSPGSSISTDAVSSVQTTTLSSEPPASETVPITTLFPSIMSSSGTPIVSSTPSTTTVGVDETTTPVSSSSTTTTSSPTSSTFTTPTSTKAATTTTPFSNTPTSTSETTTTPLKITKPSLSSATTSTSLPTSTTTASATTTTMATTIAETTPTVAIETPTTTETTPTVATETPTTTETTPTVATETPTTTETTPTVATETHTTTDTTPTTTTETTPTTTKETPTSTIIQITTSTKSTPIMLTTTSTVATKASTTAVDYGPCEDTLEDCPHFDCNDETNTLWLWENCRQTCKRCLEKKPCQDIITNCAETASFVCGNADFAAIEAQCQRTCQLCD